jgi:hypothetical protein
MFIVQRIAGFDLSWKPQHTLSVAWRMQTNKIENIVLIIENVHSSHSS